MHWQWQGLECVSWGVLSAVGFVCRVEQPAHLCVVFAEGLPCHDAHTETTCASLAEPKAASCIQVHS